MYQRYYLYEYNGVTSDGKNCEGAEKAEALADYENRFGSPLNLGQIPIGMKLVIDAEALIHYCKFFGHMLHARRGKTKPKHVQGSFSDGERVPVGASSFCFLQRMVAGPGDTDGIEPSFAGYLVAEAVLADLNKQLQEEGPARRISSWPIVRTFLYLDVSDFSKEKPGREALIINSIVGLVGEWQYWNCHCAIDVQRAVEAKICIGDGYIFVFQKPEDGVYFGAWLAQLIEELVARKSLPVEFHFRMGVHTGEVYSFWDPGRGEQGDWNYIGDGIKGGNRVLAAVGKQTDDVMFISGAVRSALMATGKDEFPFNEIRKCLHNRGRKADKHGNPWRVYELNHSQLCAEDVAGALRLGGPGF